MAWWLVHPPKFQPCGLVFNPGLFIFCSLMSSLLVLVLGGRGLLCYLVFIPPLKATYMTQMPVSSVGCAAESVA